MSISNMLKKALLVTVGATAFTFGIVQTARASVLTFDDIRTYDERGVLIPNGYGGFNWNNFYVLNGSDPIYASLGYNNGRISGDSVAFNSGGEPAIVSNGLFDFNSSYLTSAWRNGMQITVEGLKEGTALYSKTVVVDRTAPRLVNFNFLGIDAVRFSAFGGVNPGSPNGDGTHFVIDNFTFNEKVSIPEPNFAVLLLMVSPIACFLLQKRNTKQASIGLLFDF